MAEWVETFLSDILMDKGYIRGPFGSALKRGDMKEEGIPVYEQQHAIYNSRDFRYYIDEQKFNEMKRFQVRKDDLIISCSGTVGKVSIIKDNDPKGIISQALLLLRVDTNKILPLYLKYFFSSRDGYNAIVSRSSGSVQVNIAKRSSIEQIPLKLPQIKTQKKIVGILSSIDEKIEENERINNNLEEQAMTLFKSWFIDYEPFDKQVLTTWKYGVLGDFVEIKRGGSPRPIQNFLSNRGLHWLKISDATCISSPFVNEIKEYIIEEGLKKTVFLKAGSLVLSNSATPGLPKVLDIDTCIHDGWLYFPSSKFSNEYLYLYFKYIRNNLVALGNGSVFTNLKTDILKNYPTNLPTDDVLNKFDKIVKPIFSMILSKTRESKRLIEIRDTLLPKLMSGELDVSNIDL